MALEGFAEKHIGGKSKRVFGRPFEGDAHANGLLALHRLGPSLPRHFADHAGLKVSSVERRILPAYAKRDIPLVKSVPLTGTGVGTGGRPVLLYALTKYGYNELLECANANWPEEEPEAALGHFIKPPDHVRWKLTTDHDLVTRDILLAADRDARHLVGTRLIDQVPEFRHWGGKPSPTAIMTPLDRRMKPDAANVLQRGNISFADEIEIDLGTEALVTNNPDRVFETIEGKIRSYWSVLAAGLVKAKYQVESPIFRVLFVTTSLARAKHIAELVADLASEGALESLVAGNMEVTPHDIFLATTIEQAKAAFFDNHWIKPDLSTTALAERAVS